MSCAEHSALAVDDIQIRQEHCANADLVGQGSHIRTSPTPKSEPIHLPSRNPDSTSALPWNCQAIIVVFEWTIVVLEKLRLRLLKLRFLLDFISMHVYALVHFHPLAVCTNSKFAAPSVLPPRLEWR